VQDHLCKAKEKSVVSMVEGGGMRMKSEWKERFGRSTKPSEINF